MFCYTRNHVTSGVRSDVLPWDFKAKAEIPLTVRKDKIARQEWYRNAATDHHFYTGLEGVNNVMRPSKDNPPIKINAFVADYDLPIPRDTVYAAVEGMPFKPTWIEKSLGGNVRLVWLLERPLRTDSADFCRHILTQAVGWLALHMLPGLDEAAFTEFSRLYANGCEWEALGHAPISEKALQAFFVAAAKGFKMKPTDGMDIPMDKIEEKLKELFPFLQWPSDFTPGSQGPSFWIPESTSPMSAIVKPGGMLTFSAHATKTFYPWSDILGAEFVKQFKEDAISGATLDVWFDGRKFWRKLPGSKFYLGEERVTFGNYLATTCNLSGKAVGSSSPQQDALQHIYDHARVEGVGPFAMRRPGVIVYQGKRFLNTFSRTPIEPYPEPCTPEDFPFLRSMIWNLFPTEEPIIHLLAWFQRSYRAALDWKPNLGLAYFLLGCKSCGKTTFNRHVVGAALGGFIDASKEFLGGEPFNSHLLEATMWCVDDDSVNSSPEYKRKFASQIKKHTANSDFVHNKKFEVACQVERHGRLGITANLDADSSSILGPMDEATLAKIHIFRGVSEARHDFISEEYSTEKVKEELPKFLRWLLDWTPPDYLVPDTRYGFASYHDPELLRQVHHGGVEQIFLSALRAAVVEYFTDHPEVPEMRMTLHGIMLRLSVDSTVRNTAPHFAIRNMNIAADRGLCTPDDSNRNERVWVFKRGSYL